MRKKDKIQSIEIENQERCAQVSGLFAFVSLVLLAVMLYLAITSQFSEQKTVYYILVVVAFFSFLLLSGITAYLVSKSNDQRSVRQQYEANNIAMRRSALLHSQQVRQDQEEKREQERMKRLEAQQLHLNYLNQTFQNDVHLQF
jgi:hypothetical protein